MSSCRKLFGFLSILLALLLMLGGLFIIPFVMNRREVRERSTKLSLASSLTFCSRKPPEQLFNHSHSNIEKFVFSSSSSTRASSSPNGYSGPFCLTFSFVIVLITTGIVIFSICLSVYSRKCPLLFLAAIPLLFLPVALRLDKVFGKSYSLPFIPFEISLIALGVMHVCFLRSSGGLHRYVLFALPVVPAFIASFVLVVLNMDGIVSFGYTLSLIPFYAALILLIVLLIAIGRDRKLAGPHTLPGGEIFPMLFLPVLLPLLLQSVLLAIRLDEFVSGHYALYFIPTYLISTIAFVIGLVLAYSEIWKNGR